MEGPEIRRPQRSIEGWDADFHPATSRPLIFSCRKNSCISVLICFHFCLRIFWYYRSLQRCTMTTNVSTIKFALSKMYCHGVSHEKKENSVFGRFSSLPPMPPPPLNIANFIFIVVSPSLIVIGTDLRQRLMGSFFLWVVCDKFWQTFVAKQKPWRLRTKTTQEGLSYKMCNATYLRRLRCSFPPP